MSDQFRKQLDQYKKKRGFKTPSPQKEKQKQEEGLSEEELKDLMGVNRPVYSRGRGGAFKQK